MCPPSNAPSQIRWQNPPHGGWLAKVAGLLYDFVLVACNTKLQSTKLSAALKATYQKGLWSLPVGLSLDSMVDRLDVSIRILLNMLRTLKMNPGQWYKMKKSLSQEEATSVDLVLQKVVLPHELLAGAPCAMEEEASTLELQPLQDSLAPHQVSATNAVSEQSTAPSMPLPLVPLVPSKAAQQPKSFGTVLKAAPSIFAKILGKQNDHTVQESGCGNQGSVQSVVATAMAFEVSNLGKGVSRKTGQVSTKPKRRNTKKKAQKAQKHCKKSESKTESTLAGAEGSKNFTFTSKKYGVCKLECYSAKSYIRQQDPVTKKMTSIIGACCENHAWICKELVKFVEKGYDKKALYERRAKLMAPDVD